MAYTTQQKVEQYGNLDLSAVSSEITAWISAVEAIINKYVGYAFGNSASGDKYYDIPKGCILFTDRFYGSPTVTIYNVDGSIFKTLVEGVGSDFVTQPYNEGYFDRIVLLKDPYLFDGIWTDIDEEDIKSKRVKVTATFGNGSSVPKDIELAATMMVTQIAQERTSGGVVKSESLGDYSVTFADIEGSKDVLSITSILDSYVDPVI